MIKPIKALSLFDGMACGYQALKQAGIPVAEYHAFEIDKYAIQIAKKNHPDIIHHGSVVGADFTQFEGFDLLLGGSPCQGFSFAGKQLAFDDPRSALFFEFVRAKNEANPKRFLLENVKMKKEHLAVITEHMGVEPIFINSALVSAQNRQRYYWCNWHNEQPDDRGIMLAGIIEEGVVDRDKGYCIDANYWKGGNPKSYYGKGRRQLVFGAANRRVAGNMEIRKDEKSNALLAGGHQSRFIHDRASFRKLTPTECERLQTLPDGYTEGVSNTQRYKMLGNGWTVAVIEHLLRGME